MSTPTPTLGQQLIALFESDVLTLLGTPLLTFLQAVQASNGDKVKQAAAFVQLQGNLVAAAPSLVGTAEGQLAAALAAKLVALQSGAKIT